MRIIQEYLTGQENVKYPFHTDASVPSWFPLDLIYEILIYINPETTYNLLKESKRAMFSFWLKELQKTNDQWIFKFQLDIQIVYIDRFESNTQETVYSSTNQGYTLTVDLDKYERNIQTYLITPTGDSYVNNIKCLINTNRQSSLPFGIWNLLKTETLFDPLCVIEQTLPVTQIIVKNNTTLGDIIVRNDMPVQFVPGYNTEISSGSSSTDSVTEEEESTRLDKITLSVNPGSGDGYTPCTHEAYKGIKSINGIENSNSNYTVAQGNCIDIKMIPSTHTITVFDKCEPCCKDCDERLDDINLSVIDLQNDIDSLDARIKALEPT